LYGCVVKQSNNDLRDRSIGHLYGRVMRGHERETGGI